MKNNKKSGLEGFLYGKGFYAALGLCLLGAVTAAWVTATGVIGSSGESKNVPKPEVKTVNEENYDPADSIFASEEVGSAKEDVAVESKSETEEVFNFVKKGTSFSKPVEGEIAKNHSGGELVKYEALGEWRTHDGIDIACEVGSEIKAAADGKITAVNTDPLWGTVVEITHKGNIISIYGGLSPEVSVKVGDEVKAGDVIGTLGETNLAEVDMNSHLHFAMKENGKFIDPAVKIK